MKPQKTRLANGLRVISVTIPTLKSVTVTIWVKTGSRFEEKKISGISHFLEHMVFKGSKKRPSAHDIAEAVDALGGEFNAGTSKEWTNFYIKARAENVDTAFDVLSDMVLSPLLEKEEIEKEKGVIVEEIAMHEDTPMMKIGDVFEELIFSGNSLAWDISGTAKSVRSVRREDFVAYRNKHYYPENILITVSGGVSKAKVEALAERYFGRLSSGKKQIKPKSFLSKQKKPRVMLYSKKKEQAHFILGFVGNPRGHPDRFAEGVLASILGGGMSSRLFTEVREKRGLAYAVITNNERYIDTGYLSTYVGADVKRVEEAIKVTLDQHYGIAAAELAISQAELSKAKEYLKGHLALALEDTKDVNAFFGERELFLGKVETPEEVFTQIDKIKIEDVLRVAKKIFVPQKLNLAIIGPYKNQERFEKLLV